MNSFICLNIELHFVCCILGISFVICTIVMFGMVVSKVVFPFLLMVLELPLGFATFEPVPPHVYGLGGFGLHFHDESDGSDFACGDLLSWLQLSHSFQNVMS